MKNKEYILEVTEEEYAENLKKGWTEDDMLPVGKHKFKRVSPDRVASKEDLHPSNTKVQITIKLDLDVLNYFKERAADARAAPYQTQINNELRSVMEREKTVADKNIKEQLLQDTNFIKAVAEEIRKVA